MAVGEAATTSPAGFIATFPINQRYAIVTAHILDNDLPAEAAPRSSSSPPCCGRSLTGYAEERVAHDAIFGRTDE